MSTAEETYGIRHDYVVNAENRTLEQDDTLYWEPDRIKDNFQFQWPVYKYARKLIQTRKLQRVLDVGCGPAPKLMDLIAPVAEVWGIDQPGVIDYCKQTYSDGHFLVDNFEDPKLTFDEPFDLIICSDVIEHMTNPDMLLNYLNRLASPQTLILLSTPDRERLRGLDCLHSPLDEHIREWSTTEFSDYLTSRGFTLLESQLMQPIKFGFNRVFFGHYAHQLLKLRPFNYNIVTLCQVAEQG